MRNSFRIIAFILMLVTVIGMTPISTFAVDSTAAFSDEGSEGLQYEVVSGAAYIVGYSGSDNIVTIPATYQGYSIVALDPECFAWNTDITAVIIKSEGIIGLTDGEFAGCEGLKYVEIPASVTDIMGITMWSGNVIPEIRYHGNEGDLNYDESEVGTVIYNYVPHVHKYTSEVFAPDCVNKGYTKYTCSDCGESYMDSFTPALGHTYDDKLDEDCNVCGDIREIEIIVADGKCGEETFWRLRDNGTLIIYGSGSTEDYLVNIAKDQPYRAYASKITKVVVEEGVLSLGRGAFYGFTAITEVVLPDSLIAIHEYAFFGCTAIKTMNIPENTFYIGLYALRKTGLTTLDFANAKGWKFSDGTALDPSDMKGTLAAFKTANTYKLTCQRPVTEVGEATATGVFGAKDQFTWTLSSTGVLTVSGKGDMPKFNVNTTPWYGYRGAIRAVVIEEGITSVGRCSFHTCRAITTVTLPESLETLVEYAFYNCQYLTRVTIPANVTSIGTYVFRKCFELTDVEFGIKYGWSAGGSPISVNVLSGRSSAADTVTLEYYTVVWTRDVNAEEEIADPNYVTGGMCNPYTKWQLVWIDSAKTKMKLTVSGNGAMPIYGTGSAPWYSYRANITEVEVMAGVTDIGRCAFYGLNKLTVVTIHDGVKAIGDYAFNACSSLKSIYIPASVEKIGVQAFAKSGLTSVTLAKCAGWSLSDGTVIDTLEMSDEALVAEYVRDAFKAFSWTRDTSAMEETPDNGWYGGKYYIDGEYVVSCEMWIGADYYSFDSEGNSTRITKDDGFTGNY